MAHSCAHPYLIVLTVNNKTSKSRTFCTHEISHYVVTSEVVNVFYYMYKIFPGSNLQIRSRKLIMQKNSNSMSYVKVMSSQSFGDG
jgi:hypothetical protein